ncbi:MAG TPA: ParA family protein [Actinomycetota bacterium]|nr:ParA family protein [Actinomycetota bacterium]
MALPGIQKWQILERRPPRVDGWLVCVANQKGGVGKTTTTLNLGAALAARGRRVLVVDIDPQANATTGLGLDHRAGGKSTYDLIMQEASLPEVVVPTPVSGLQCAPASVDLAGAEIELVTALAREHRLQECLVEAAGTFDVVFIDCPPSLGLLTINAMVAADDLVVPVQCEYYALEGLGQLVGNAERVRKSLNRELRIAGILLTMYDARTNLSPEVAEEVRKHFGPIVYDTVIPRSIKLSEAPSFGEPAVTLDPSSRGARSYLALADEIASTRDGSQTEGAPSPTSVSVPGPGGRGYGVATPIPPGIERAWPPLQPWTGTG